MKLRTLVILNGVAFAWLIVSAATMVAVKVRAEPELKPGSLAQSIGSGPLTFMVWGDSHGGTLMPLFRELAAQHHVAGEAFLGRGVVPLLWAYSPQASASRSAQSELASEAVNASRKDRIPYVFIVGRWEARVPYWHPTMTDVDRQDEWKRTIIEDDFTEEQSLADSARVLAEALPRSIEAITVNNPHLRRIYFIMQPPARDGDNGDVPVSEATYRLQQRAIGNALASLRCDKLTVLGPGSNWIKSGMSVNGDEGGSYYSDRHHLSSYGAAKLMRPLLAPIFNCIGRSADKGQAADYNRSM